MATAFAPRAQAQDNLRDAAPFNGYTGVKFDTTNYAYDYLVDSSLSQDDPAAKKFRTLEAAYAAAPAGTPGQPTVIGIKPDVYLMHVGRDAPYSLQSPRTTSPSSASPMTAARSCSPTTAATRKARTTTVTSSISAPTASA